MSEVVGTAFVRIQAITTGLAKEIERGIKKGTADARVDDAGEALGDEFAESARESMTRGMSGALDDVADKMAEPARRNGRRIGGRFGRGIGEGVDGDGDFLRSLRQIFRRSEDESGRGGRRSGARFGRGFGGGMRGILRSPGVLLTGVFSALPALGGLVNLIGQYVVALTGHLGSLIVAATGAGLVIGGVLGAALLAIGPLMAAFLVETPQLEAFKQAAGELGKEWKVVAEATQRELLPALLRSMRSMRVLIPIFSDFGAGVGRVAGEFAEMAAAALTTEEAQGRWQRILSGSTPILQTMGRATINLGDALSRLFEAVLPLAQDFALRVEAMTARWADLINLAGLPGGGLESTLQRWYETAIIVWGVLSDLTAILWNLFDAGSQESMPFFESFGEWAEEFRAWTTSEVGQNRLAQIFSQAMEVASEFNGLIADIFRAIGSDIFAEGGADGLIASLQTLREDVVPWLDSTFREVIDTLGPSLKDFAGSLGEMFQAMSETGSLTIAINTLDGLVQVWTRILDLPGIGNLLGALMGLGTAFMFLKTLGATKLVGALSGALSVLAGVIGTVLLGATAPAWATMAVGVAVLAAIAGAVYLVVTQWDTLVGAFQAVVRFIGDPMDRLERLGEILGDLASVVADFVGGAFSDLGGVFADVGRSIGRFASDLGSDIYEGLTEAFFTALDAVKAFPGQAARALGSFGSTVIGALVTGVRALPGILRDIFVGAMQFAINAIATVILSAPYLLVMAIVRWGPAVGNALSTAFRAAVDFLTSTLPSIIGGVISFFMGLPATLIEALVNLGGMLLDVYSAAFEAVLSFLVETALPGLLDFFLGLPGNIYGALVGLGGILADVFRGAMDAGKQVVSTGIDDIKNFFLNLPGNIREALADVASAALDIGSAIVSGLADGLSAAVDIAGDIASAARDAFVSMINSVIDLLNDGIPNSLGWGPARINLPDNPIPRINLAMGGIFSSATPAVIGEAGREVVIPLTRPNRAAQLAQQSGLYDVLARARGGTASSSAPGGRAGNNVNVQVYAQGTPAGTIVAEMEAKIDWAMTTRSDR